MNRIFSTLLFLPLLFAGSSGCGDSSNAEDSGDRGDRVEEHAGRLPQPGGAFGDYWYQGKAELSRFRLEQARYGEIREGDAVLIFVTEDFLTDAQVKLESDPGDRPYGKILKLNMTKSFLTGLYPYSMMTSVFTPVGENADDRTLKVTTSSQEWCGHTFTQLNRAEKGTYRVREYSYFEGEGDRDESIAVDLLEDELWTRIRIDPASLPLGTVRVLPGTMTARLRHTPHRPLDANTSIVDLPPTADGATRRYTIEYTDPARTLMIDFRKEFPHDIVAFSETYNDFGEVLTTRAVRTDTILIDYWSRNASADTVLRKELGL